MKWLWVLRKWTLTRRRKLEKLSTSYCVSVISTHFKASTKSLFYLLGAIKSSLVLPLIFAKRPKSRLPLLGWPEISFGLTLYLQKHKLRDSFQKCLHFWCGMEKNFSFKINSHNTKYFVHKSKTYPAKHQKKVGW